METDLRYPLPLWKCWLLIIAESPINGDVFKTGIKKYLMSLASFIQCQIQPTLRHISAWLVYIIGWICWLVIIWISEQYLNIPMEQHGSSWEINRNHARVGYKKMSILILIGHGCVWRVTVCMGRHTRGFENVYWIMTWCLQCFPHICPWPWTSHCYVCACQ